MASGRAEEWKARGAYFSWTPPEAGAAPVDVFHVEIGAEDAPVLLLVHGFPTSSIDWFPIADRLAAHHRVCALDFPGYGFSDKPRGWGYSLARDAELLEHYVSEVLGASDLTVVAHDRGDSVALAFATRGDAPSRGGAIKHLVLTNANIFLPLSNLTDFQRLVLDPTTAPDVLAATTPRRLAEGLGLNTFTPKRGPGDPEVEALAECFAHADGTSVLHETIQYLVERSQNERGWLSRLAASDVPTTVIWGLYDTVSPVRVAAYVWNEYLVSKPGRNALYFLPGANHYLQNDRPDAFVDTVLHALDPPAGRSPGAIADGVDAPLFVDASRRALPEAAEVLRGAKLPS